MSDLETFTVREVKRIHTGILQESHEEAFDQVLNEGSLEIAVAAPMRFVYGTEIYPDIISKAAVLMYELTTLHPFVEGNKRTGFVCADMFLILNDNLLVATMEERRDVSIRLADMKVGMERDELIAWFQKRTKETATAQNNNDTIARMTDSYKQLSNRFLGKANTRKAKRSR